jgi:serine/threonine-protein kinase PpkA
MSAQIPGYQVIRKVGDGGMSTVYLAIQLSVGREVALKVLSPELRTDPAFGERFYREANIVGGFSHPNVISIYDVFRHGKHYYMAMDYLPGASCKDLIKNREITPLKALKILKDATQALEYVHNHNYLHCDIKPDNILFRTNGSAVITDFGIARELPDEKTHTVAGTPYYMSPEQAQGHKLDKSSDIYSLGVLLYEMLMHRVPFQGKDPIAIAIKHVSAPIPPLNDELQALTPLLTKMMAKRPGARFQNCNELIHAIDFIESQYLKQNNTSLPLKLKIEFALQRLGNNLKNFFKLSKRLHFSLKHGLILKMAEKDISISDIEAIAKNAEKNHMTQGSATTINMAGLTNDSLALALETEQAKKLIPALAMNIGVALLAALLLLPAAIHIITSIQNTTGKPTIIYID